MQVQRAVALWYAADVMSPLTSSACSTSLRRAIAATGLRNGS
jgi:hypothetical protein